MFNEQHYIKNLKGGLLPLPHRSTPVCNIYSLLIIIITNTEPKEKNGTRLICMRKNMAIK